MQNILTFVNKNVIIGVSNETLFAKLEVFMNIKQFLQDNFFLFNGLDDKKIERLLTINGISEERYSQGDIMQNNKTSCKIGILVKGKAIIKSGDDGVIIRKLNSNDIYGAACLFDPPKHLTVVKAVTDCTVITMNKEFVEGCISEEKGISINYIEFLAKKISFLNTKINAYTAKSAENKLYTYLLQLPREDRVIDLMVDMSTIAKMIGIGRATLYRAFEKLENSGTITKHDKKIILNEV